MTFQFSTAGRNAALDAIFSTIGASAILRIRTGAPPANIAAAATGTVLATMTLPSTYMNAASGGTKTKTGTWEDLSADAAGTAGYFEIVRSDGTTREQQGTITATGGGGDMTLDNIVIALAQAITVTAYTVTAGGA